MGVLHPTRARLPKVVLEVWIRCCQQHPPEVFVGVPPEVEIELRDPTLQHPPHRLAKVGHQPHEPEGGKVRRPLDTEVRSYKQPIFPVSYTHLRAHETRHD